MNWAAKRRRSLFSLCGVAIAASVLAISSREHTPSGSQSRVSYGREIAPIFALHCNGCHGGSTPSSQFRVSTYPGLRSGGGLGDDIVPEFPDRSMLVKFIEG
ncbi:MAG TPA: c-type cytochrome domain-containing protein, partial [Edaphobacter sp.]|nr:c-type cytochrome domain-containing protein [Edaphobacter sp.]